MSAMMFRLANPARFLRLATLILPWCAWATVALFAAGLYTGLVVSPPDYQQGDSVRIMYIHVPAAWMALSTYTLMAAASAASLVWKHPLADLVAKSAAPIGAAFTLITLITGSLWGQPSWGTWWVWDARLTSMLVLFFLYLGHMAIMNAFEDPVRGFRAAAVLALAGFVHVPIIHFSVDWWSTLHPPARVLRVGRPATHPPLPCPRLAAPCAR